ncbi:MAG: MMPL family transporter, partial [Micrococcus sp.]|nr:MMPL family transporter [Micrococcus sp.]
MPRLPDLSEFRTPLRRRRTTTVAEGESARSALSASTERGEHAGRGDAGGGDAAGSGRQPSALLRFGLAAVLFLVWFAVMGVGGPTFGNLSDVQSNDQATFLPASAESTIAGERAADFRDGTAIPAVIVGSASTADPAAAFPALAALGEAIGEVAGVDQVIGPIPSEDGEAVQLVALIGSGDDAERESADVVADLRELLDDPAGADAELADTVVSEATWHVTGPAGLSADLGGAFAGIDGLLLIVALVVVFVILISVYRSVLLPILVLLTSVAALCAAIVAVYWMATWDWIQLNGQAQGILSILVIGATTDYCLLLVARHREELLRREKLTSALLAALKGSFGAITASATTVGFALLILLFSDLNSNSSLGPIAASGILFAWLAALTFLPALLQLFGRAAFWPTIPSAANAAKREEKRAAKGKVFEQPRDERGRRIEGLEEDHGIWTRVAAVVARRARTVWLVTAAVLLALAAGITQLQASGVSQTDVLLGSSDARDGQELLAEHFDAGAGSPAEIVAPEGVRDEVITVVEAQSGVASAEFEVDRSEQEAAAQSGQEAQAG